MDAEELRAALNKELLDVATEAMKDLAVSPEQNASVVEARAIIQGMFVVHAPPPHNLYMVCMDERCYQIERDKDTYTIWYTNGPVYAYYYQRDKTVVDMLINVDGKYVYAKDLKQ